MGALNRRKTNTVQVPQISAAASVARFAEAAKAQTEGLKSGLSFYKASLEEATEEMRKGYGAANKTLSTLSESSNRALDETMRMLNLNPIRREGESYKGKYSSQEVIRKLEATPGYQFQLDQGTKAIERQGAARGMLGSGNTLLALQEYGQQQAQGYFQGYLENLNRVTEGGKAATAMIAGNQATMGKMESQRAMMLGRAERETEMNIGRVRADEQFRAQAAENRADEANKNNAYRYFATMSNKAAQDYQTSSGNARAADKLDFAREKFQYEKNQGIDAFNQSQGGFSDNRVSGWIN